MHCLKLTTNAPSHDTQFDIALGNHALCAQPAKYRLVSYLLEDNLLIRRHHHNLSVEQCKTQKQLSFL